MLTIKQSAEPQDESMLDERLRELVQELNEAENEHLDSWQTLNCPKMLAHRFARG